MLSKINMSCDPHNRNIAMTPSTSASKLIIIDQIFGCVKYSSHLHEDQMHRQRLTPLETQPKLNQITHRREEKKVTHVVRISRIPQVAKWRGEL
jgi:hypothetical protein